MSLRKHTNLWQVATESLFRYRARAISIGVPLFLVVFLVSAMTFVKDGFLRDAQLSVSIMPDITVQKLVGGRIERVPIGLVDQISQIDQVERVLPRVWGFLPITISENQSAAYTLMGIDLSTTPIPEQMGMSVEEGSFLSQADSDGAVIGKAFAQAFGVKVGEQILIKDALGNEDEFKIVGIFSTPVQVYTADLILVPIDKARQFFGYDENEATDLNVYLDSSLHGDFAARAILDLSEKSRLNLRVVTRDAFAEVTQAAYGGRAGVFQVMWLILLVGVMIVAWTQGSNISFELRREVGVLKAIGWGISDVIETKLFEASIVGLIGVLAGLLVGLAYLLLGAPGMKSYFIGWSTVYPEFPLPIHISPKSVLLILVVGLVPLLVATLIPAWLAGVIEPDEAMRK